MLVFSVTSFGTKSALKGPCHDIVTTAVHRKRRAGGECAVRCAALAGKTCSACRRCRATRRKATRVSRSLYWGLSERDAIRNELGHPHAGRTRLVPPLFCKRDRSAGARDPAYGSDSPR